MDNVSNVDEKWKNKITKLKQQLQEEEKEYSYYGGRIDMLTDIINQLEEIHNDKN